MPLRNCINLGFKTRGYLILYLRDFSVRCVRVLLNSIIEQGISHVGYMD